MINFSTKILISHYQLLFLIFLEVKRHKTHPDKAFMVVIILLRNQICNGINEFNLWKNELYSVSVLSAVAGVEFSCNTYETVFNDVKRFHYSGVYFVYVSHNI